MQHLERAHSILKASLEKVDPIELPNGHFKVELDDGIQVGWPAEPFAKMADLLIQVDIAPDGTTVVQLPAGVEVEHR